jgi:Fe-S cluster biogenesis protein NfuA
MWNYAIADFEAYGYKQETSVINYLYELNQQNTGENIMKEKVEKALQKVRPMLQADGGDVELVDVQDGIVTVRLQGACGGCPMSQMTLKNGIERILKEEVPEVVSVESAP